MANGKSVVNYDDGHYVPAIQLFNRRDARMELLSMWNVGIKLESVCLHLLWTCQIHRIKISEPDETIIYCKRSWRQTGLTTG